MQTNKGKQSGHGNSHSDGKDGMKNSQRTNTSSDNTQRSGKNKVGDENYDEYIDSDEEMDDMGEDEEVETEPKKREHNVRSDKQSNKHGQQSTGSKKATGTHK